MPSTAGWTVKLWLSTTRKLFSSRVFCTDSANDFCAWLNVFSYTARMSNGCWSPDQSRFPSACRMFALFHQFDSVHRPVVWSYHCCRITAESAARW